MNIEKLESCPVCTGKELNTFKEVKDYSISGETFKIVVCANCGFKFTNPRPTEAEIGKYYQSEDYISHSDVNKGIINKIYHWVRTITLRKKVKLIAKLSPKSNILDIGCGTGYFLKSCKENGWNITGMEPDDQARKIAFKQTEVKIVSDINELNDPGNFSIITMWHVLEHVHLLNEMLTKINLLLKDRGILIIAVPNPDSLDAKFYKNYWAAYDVPRHLYHFNRKSIEKLLINHSFKLKEVKPMPFDSFYVSLMSEKYKSGNNITNYFSAFIKGLESNISAMFKNQNYSSLIYIAEKIGNEK